MLSGGLSTSWRRLIAAGQGHEIGIVDVIRRFHQLLGLGAGPGQYLVKWRLFANYSSSVGGHEQTKTP